MPAKTQKQLLEANMKELLEKLAELDRIEETTDPTVWISQAEII